MYYVLCIMYYYYHLLLSSIIIIIVIILIIIIIPCFFILFCFIFLFYIQSYVISPNSVVDLRFIELKGSNPYKKSWNDNIRSLITTKKQEILISPINEKQDSKVGEYCFNLYGSSPVIIKHTKGMEWNGMEYYLINSAPD